MALRASRYSKLYLQLARPDVSHSFPQNIFIREPNKVSYKSSNNNTKRLWVKQ